MQTIRELIEALEEAAEQHGDDARVRIAFQPSYPLAAQVRAVSVSQDDDEEEEGPDEHLPVVWIAASDSVPSGESPYAPRSAWDGAL